MTDPILPGGEAGLREALALEISECLLNEEQLSWNDIADRLITGPLAQIQSDSVRLQQELAAVDLAFEGLEETDRARRIGHWIGLAAAETTRANAAEAELASFRAKTAGGAGDPRVDTQVWSAARSLSHQRAKQPEWLWFAKEDSGGIPVARYSYGRWAKLPEQAPYVRADIALGIRSLPLDPSPQREGGGA